MSLAVFALLNSIRELSPAVVVCYTTYWLISLVTWPVLPRFRLGFGESRLGLGESRLGLASLA